MARSKLEASNAWRQSIRERLRSKGLTASQILDVGTRTVAGWTGLEACSWPELQTLRSVASALDYPLADQLVDLGLVDELEARPALGVSKSVLLAQIARITEAAGMVRPGIQDMARALLDSCTETRHFGRWRARLFDVEVGSEFRHVGFHGLEALRWRGPGGERGSAERLSALKDLVCGLIPDEAERSFFATPGVWQHGDAAAWERAEILWRMRKVAPLVVVNSYGYEGDAHLPLVHRQDLRPKRHIFLEPAGPKTAPDPATAIRISRTDAATGVSRPVDRIALIAPPMVGGVALARLIGHGLGWECVSISELVGRHTGRRFRVSHGEERDYYNRRVMEQILTIPPARPTLYVIPALASLSKDGVVATVTRRLLQDERVLSVTLRPSRATALAWFDRQLRQVTPETRPPETRADELLSVATNIVKFSTSQGHQVANLELLHDLDWNNAHYFEAPEIGDVRLRTAYEIGYLLLHGELPGRQIRGCAFVEGSLLNRHHTKLVGTTRQEQVARLIAATDFEGVRS